MYKVTVSPKLPVIPFKIRKSMNLTQRNARGTWDNKKGVLIVYPQELDLNPDPHSVAHSIKAMKEILKDSKKWRYYEALTDTLKLIVQEVTKNAVPEFRSEFLKSEISKEILQPYIDSSARAKETQLPGSEKHIESGFEKISTYQDAEECIFNVNNARFDGIIRRDMIWMLAH